MGDVGALGLGGALGAVACLMRQPFLLAIVGGVFVVEAVSVILQVAYFKRTGGQRLFLMTPIHHHFQAIGWPESKIVMRFWVVSLVAAAGGLRIATPSSGANSTATNHDTISAIATTANSEKVSLNS